MIIEKVKENTFLFLGSSSKKKKTSEKSLESNKKYVFFQKV